MALTDQLNALDKAVEDAQAKQVLADKAQAAAAQAQKNYSDALATVDKLKSELVDKIGNIFPQSGRVRIAS